eukprot:CAMPEP_0206427252 /NCGR_PEP_ID=MMETSP0324_2-20121206/4914_1 /ASSEMBLY_ACC=CAM_ASM_000836 /TAXON_ID=2866 /ORGANISM="Crypthecodinium cohnii, Strain Seligo" /LENGTH=205 /DNA_ID=CAMNT_0053892465 /DNA_START=748 /DNA_END=1365 /DNA_ORIENTATION=-
MGLVSEHNLCDVVMDMDVGYEVPMSLRRRPVHGGFPEAAGWRDWFFMQPTDALMTEAASEGGLTCQCACSLQQGPIVSTTSVSTAATAAAAAAPSTSSPAATTTLTTTAPSSEAAAVGSSAAAQEGEGRPGPIIPASAWNKCSPQESWSSYAAELASSYSHLPGEDRLEPVHKRQCIRWSFMPTPLAPWMDLSVGTGVKRGLSLS